MTRLSGLIQRHKNLSEKITDLEKERNWNRTFHHKQELINLKKEKLKIKEKKMGLSLMQNL